MREYIGEILGMGTTDIYNRIFKLVKDGDYFYLIRKKDKADGYEEQTTFRLERIENKHTTWYLENLKAPTILQQVLEDVYKEHQKKKLYQEQKTD